MRILYLAFCLLLISRTSSAQDFEFFKDALTFPNGDIITNPVNRSLPIPNNRNPLKIYVEYSNQIEGDITDQGFINHSEIYMFQSHLYRNTDDAGRPVGSILKPQFIILKPVDSATADLMQNLSSNSIITELKIKMLTLNTSTSSLEELMRVTLGNVKIVDYRLESEYDLATGTYFFFEKYYLQFASLSFDNFVSPGSTTIN